MNTRLLLGALLALGLFSLPLAAVAQDGLARPVVPFEGTAQFPLPVAIIRIVNVFLTIAALAAAIFLVIGGIRYIASQGDDEAVEKAKNTILYAIIGLIVIGLAAAIVNFVVASISDG